MTDDLLLPAYDGGCITNVVPSLLHPGEAPGLGVDIDEDLAAKYPYQRAYLPVARRLDGSMHDW